MKNVVRRQHIDDLGIKYKDTPQGTFSDQDDGRFPMWQKLRNKYGFDEREVWDITFSFELWLYERLMMYNDTNMIDTGMHTYVYKGKTLTLQNGIDRMIQGLEISLTNDGGKPSDKEFEQTEDVRYLFALCYHQLWW